MIIKNDAKGTYGAFSNVGRATVNEFINIKKQDKILNPEKHLNYKTAMINFLKRNKYTNIDGDESKEEIKNDENFEEESESEEPIEEHDIFDIKEDEKIKNEKDKQKNKKIGSQGIYHRTNSEAYKYHDINMKKKRIKKKFFTPNCTKYFPSKDFVWHRSPKCLKWDAMQKRKPMHLNIYDGTLLEHEDPLKNITNIFVNMDKQTMRGDTIKSNNVRIQTAKPFEREKHIQKRHRKKRKRIKTGIMRKYDINLQINTENNFNQGQATTQLTEDTNKINVITTSDNKSKLINEEKKDSNYPSKEIIAQTEVYNIDEPSSDSDDSYSKYKPHYLKQLKANTKQEIPDNREKTDQNYPLIKTENNVSNVLNTENKRPKTGVEKIKGPEFDKIISREYYDNLNDNGITLIPFAVNNYKQVRERALTMVKYNTKKSFKKKLDFFKGIEIGQYLNTPINYIQHKNYVPMFNKMHTRPMDDGIPLPVFMKGVVSRNVCDMTSNVSLKMNSYIEGKTRGNYNTCLPKKSFNELSRTKKIYYNE